MAGQVRLTEAEKERVIAQVRTGLAFGGGTLSSDVEQGLRDILDGKITGDEYRAQLRAKYVKYMTEDACD